MSIYAISDLHLTFGVKDKPMDVFGDRWQNYEERLKENWLKFIHDDDTVIIAGDVSWAMYLEESLEDFKWIDSLPGKKIILKGNHDYWWETVTKMNNFLKENSITSIEFLYNNAIEVENRIICGTRYWSEDEEADNLEKVFNREIERTKISLNAAKQIDDNKEIIFVTHYPPDQRIVDVVKDYPVKTWLYGHIHSNYEEIIVESCALVAPYHIDIHLTSGDYLEFIPIQIM